MYKKGVRILNIFVSGSVKKSWLMGAVCACVTTMSSFTVNAAATVTSLTGTIEVMVEADGLVKNVAMYRPPSTLTWIQSINTSTNYFIPPLFDPSDPTCEFFPDTPGCAGSYLEVSAYADTNSTIAASGEHFIANGITETTTFPDLFTNDPGFVSSYATSAFDLIFSLDSTYNYSLIGETFGLAQVTLPNGLQVVGVGGAISASGVLTPGEYTLSGYATADGAMLLGGVNPYSGYSIEFTLAPVPVPAAVWLFGSGLLGLISVARRK